LPPASIFHATGLIADVPVGSGLTNAMGTLPFLRTSQG
jgi:hypothetical protein